MATYVPYTPTSLIGKALFNFDGISGKQNYKYSGPVTISVSDAFTYAQYSAYPSLISQGIYTSLTSGSAGWNSAQLANINLITDTYSNFINCEFTSVFDCSGYNPYAIGAEPESDINISMIYRPDLPYSGMSAGNTDYMFRYSGSRGDIVLNVDKFGSSGLSNDYGLDSISFGFHALMHEIGHSLGLSHPHGSYVNGVGTLTADYAATMNAGFDKLGFNINSPADMNKEYFSIMSYDEESPPTGPNTYAQTPMILDVIALQGAYGEGRGSSGAGNDTIPPGGFGDVAAFRTYFDTGGNDTINLANYTFGAYLNMGTEIVGASHLVGVSMSIDDARKMFNGDDPASLRWFYGEYENASGSAAIDLIVGNVLNNIIGGQGGDDIIFGGGGNDRLDGGSGCDTALFSGNRANCTITKAGSTFTVKGTDGTDTLTNIERLEFADMAVGFDINGNAGQVYRLYQAAFNRTPDKGGLGDWIYGMDHGMSLLDVSAGFIGSNEFKTVYGQNPTDSEVVTRFYENVLHRAPEQAGYDYWMNQLQSNLQTRTQVLTGFSESPENQVQVIGVIQNGIEYIPHQV